MLTRSCHVFICPWRYPTLTSAELCCTLPCACLSIIHIDSFDHSKNGYSCNMFIHFSNMRKLLAKHLYIMFSSSKVSLQFPSLNVLSWKTSTFQLTSLHYSVQHGTIFTDVYNYIILIFPSQKMPIIFAPQQHYASPDFTVGWALTICLSYNTNKSNGLVLGKSLIYLMLYQCLKIRVSTWYKSL